jgi:hypothetical protein
MADEEQPAKHRRSLGGLVVELAMIVVGVFLGASAEQWRETRHHHDLATASLRNLRSEVADNRATVAHVRAYHLALGGDAWKFVQGTGPRTLQAFFRSTHWHGVAPVEFKQQNSFMQGAFTPATFAAYRDATGLAGALASYFEDVNIQEPRLLELYDGLLPQIDSALGGAPPGAPKTVQPASDSKGR